MGTFQNVRENKGVSTVVYQIDSENFIYRYTDGTSFVTNVYTLEVRKIKINLG